MTTKLEEVKDAFINEGRTMVRIFRARQKDAPEIEVTEAYKNAQQNVDLQKALAFGESKAGGAPHYELGQVWINRTHFAERGVKVLIDVDSDDHLAIGLYHTEPYGVYLEFANNRKYAVIEPIVRSRALPLMKKVRKIMGAKGGGEE